MRRGLLIGLAVSVVGCIVLAIALAIVGSRFDDVRLEQEDYAFQLEEAQADRDALQAERDALTTERDTLKAQTDEQLVSIEKLKAELDHARQQQSATPATP